MARSNSENVDWIAKYKFGEYPRLNGGRVPINDTGVPGAPFAALADSALWKEGSVNRAVYQTHIMQGDMQPEDIDDGTFGTLDFDKLLRYVNKDMLWGFNSDARNKVPGDYMAYRAYPTPILSHSFTATPYTTRQELIDGKAWFSGRYTILKHQLLTAYQVPYDIVYSVDIKVNNVSVETDVEFRINAGSFYTTHYRRTANDETEPPEWLPTPRGAIFHSIDTESLTGPLVCTADILYITQEPYYGTVPQAGLTVLESEYSPTVPGTLMAINLNPVYPAMSTKVYESKKAQCTEVRQNKEFLSINFIDRKFYTNLGASARNGDTVYADINGTTTIVSDGLDPGSYMFLEYAYGDYYPANFSNGETYKIVAYITIDSNSVLTYIDLPARGYLGLGCYDANIPVAPANFTEGSSILHSEVGSGSTTFTEITGFLIVSGEIGSTSYTYGIRISIENLENFPNPATAYLEVATIGELTINSTGNSDKAYSEVLELPPGRYMYTLRATLTIGSAFSSGACRANVVGA